jgi:hypothetical protein
MILDCCHSGAFAEGRTGDGDVALGARFEGRGRIILTASRKTEYSFEGDDVVGQGVRSVFTACIIDGLRSGEADRDRDGYVTASDLYDHVDDAIKRTGRPQTPGLWTYGAEGSIVVAKSPRSPKNDPTAPLEYLAHALESPHVRERVVQALAEVFGGADSVAAWNARRALEELARRGSPDVAAAARNVLSHEDQALGRGVGETHEARVGGRDAIELVDRAVVTLIDSLNEAKRSRNEEQVPPVKLDGETDPSIRESVGQLASERGLSAEAVAATLGVRLRDAGQLDKAQPLLEAAADAGDAMAANTLGLVLEEQGRVEEARRRFSESAERADDQGRYNYGRLLARDGRNEEAANWLSRSSDPLAVELLQQIGSEGRPD